MTRTYHLVIVSPSDVSAERSRVRSAVLTFNEKYEGRFKVKVTSYDRDMAPDMRRAQTAAFEDLGFYEADLIVGILWSRMGTPPGGDGDPDTGEAYPSGTAEELAEAARLRARGALMRTMVYECTRAVPLPKRFFRSNQRQEVEEYCAHLRNVHHFDVRAFETADDFEQKILDDLERVLVKAAPLPGAGLGNNVWLCCDRGSQVVQFDLHLTTPASNGGQPPLAYLICGLAQDRPASLAQRISDEITRRVPRVHGSRLVRLEIPGIDETDTVTWSPEEQGRIWVRQVAATFNAADHTLQALLRTPAFNPSTRGVIVIDHLLRLKRREQWRPGVRDALTWYLTEFWSGYPRTDPGARHPAVILLVTVLCPDSMTDRMGLHAGGERSVDVLAVRRDLEEIERQACDGCRRVLLPALSPVDCGDVLDWFRDHQIYDTEAEWNEVIFRHFGDPEEFGSRAMAEIEDTLLKIHREFTGTRISQAS